MGTANGKVPSQSIREVSVSCAMKQAGFDADMFVQRGGMYKWSRDCEEHKADMEDIASTPKPTQIRKNIKTQMRMKDTKLGSERACKRMMWSVVSGVAVVLTVRILAPRSHP